MSSAVTRLKRALVVDDDQVNRALLRAMLKKDGFEVEDAVNGQDAVERFRQGSFDLVLMDVNMPVMDGLEATRRIKAASGDTFVPVIFLTALKDDKELARCLDCGGDDFLTKPYNRVILGSKIHAFERLRASHEELKEKNVELAYHHERIQQEHEIAQSIYANTVGSGCLNSPFIKYLIAPTAAFNGDLLLAARAPAGSLHVLLGDFTGHGLPASIGALPVSDLFYGMTASGFPITEILQRINAKLNAVLPPGFFLAGCMLDLNPFERTLTVWNGGVPDGMILNFRSRELRRLPSRHLPLGVLAPGNFSSDLEACEVSDDDRVILYSDGLVESFNQAGEQFGDERLCRWLHECPEPALLVEGLLQRHREHVGSLAPHDDITLIEVDCAGTHYVRRLAAAPSAELCKPPAPWRVGFRLGSASLRHFDPRPVLMELIHDLQGLESHRERLFTVLTELFSNSLDHGILQLDSRLKSTPDGFLAYYRLREQRLAEVDSHHIDLTLENQVAADGNRLTIEVRDSGGGFDVGAKLEKLGDNRGPSGRGIQLLRALCESLEYADGGRCARAVYRW